MSEVLRVLVVEDERNHAELLAELLERAGYAVDLADGFNEGEAAILRGEHQIVITDLDLAGKTGKDLLALARRQPDPPEVLLISGVGSIEDAVEAMRHGALHYLTKPLNVSEVRRVMADAAKRVHARKRSDEEGANGVPGFEGIIGSSPAMERVFDMIRRIAPTTATVLIRGENGTGKELVARAIHRLSPRQERPFVGLNCAALSEGILESELFGHERGAFTGASKAHEGKFEYADGGTLFLDEVGEMSLGLQVKLLRVIQEREVTRLGSNRSINVDVRLLAATNRDLEGAIQEGQFREDLYYRIKVISITMPPLRERREDIPLLCEHFLGEFKERHGRQDLTGFEPEVLETLAAQAWPGNVRELQNIIETMVALAPAPGQLQLSDLPPEIAPAAPSPSTALVSRDKLEEYTLDQWEKELIKLQLDRQDGNRAKVAKALGISERTLYRKLKEYDLS